MHSVLYVVGVDLAYKALDIESLTSPCITELVVVLKACYWTSSRVGELAVKRGIAIVRVAKSLYIPQSHCIVSVKDALGLRLKGSGQIAPSWRATPRMR